jgi:hypothetical protein
MPIACLKAVTDVFVNPEDVRVPAELILGYNEL